MMCVHFVLQKSLHLNHQGMFEELHRNRNHQANKLSSCSNEYKLYEYSSIVRLNFVVFNIQASTFYLTIGNLVGGSSYFHYISSIASSSIPGQWRRIKFSLAHIPISGGGGEQTAPGMRYHYLLNFKSNFSQRKRKQNGWRGGPYIQYIYNQPTQSQFILCSTRKQCQYCLFKHFHLEFVR